MRPAGTGPSIIESVRGYASRMADPRARTVTLATGTEKPVIGLGTWNMTGEEAVAGVRHALELGYRMIDTSGDYGNQPEVGEGMRSAPVDRDQVFLVSKIEPGDDGPAATARLLEELGVRQLDLCLIHHPPASPDDSETLWRGLMQARRDGLTREIGVSNYSPEQVDRLIEATGETPVVNQIEWTPFGHSRAVLEHAREKGVVLQAYSPLTRGERLDDETVDEIASAHGRTPAQVMLRWSLQLGLVPLPKAANPEHREENLAVLDFELSDTEMRRLSDLEEHYSPVGGLPYD